MNEPTTIRESIKQEGLGGFLKRWKEGIKKIPPQNLLYTELIGYIGTIIGTVAAMLYFVLFQKSMWVVAIPLGFSIVIQVSSLFGKYQQYSTIKKYQVQFNELTQAMKGG